MNIGNQVAVYRQQISAGEGITYLIILHMKRYRREKSEARQ